MFECLGSIHTPCQTLGGNVNYSYSIRSDGFISQNNCENNAMSFGSFHFNDENSLLIDSWSNYSLL